MINLTIDGKQIQAEEGLTILEAAMKNGIDIPTLCFLKEINEVGDCRMCIVEVEGRRGFTTSCITKIEEGMVVHTNSKAVQEDIIYFTSATLVISKLLKSSDSKDQQPLNIPFIDITLEVSKFVKSKLLRLSQPKNI